MKNQIGGTFNIDSEEYIYFGKIQECLKNCYVICDCCGKKIKMKNAYMFVLAEDYHKVMNGEFYEYKILGKECKNKIIGAGLI